MTWMRQKPKPETETPARPAPPPQPPVATRAAEPSAPRSADGSPAVIGKSVRIKGEISGSENLTIEGQVEGRVDLGGHDLRVGPNGNVKAQIHAKAVTVEGEVVGDVTAEDRVELSTTGSLKGDIRAPRVALANGSRFKGSIDMDGGSVAKSAPSGKLESGAA